MSLIYTCACIHGICAQCTLMIHESIMIDSYILEEPMATGYALMAHCPPPEPTCVMGEIWETEPRT